MNTSRETDADWPDKIFYVCTSGAGIVVNAAPLVQAAEKIVGMRILCGVRDPKKPTDAERRESIRPAERLTEFASKQLKIACVDRIYGSPDSYVAWSDALNDSAERAEKLEATLVYNVTGGPRTVPLASILGASNAVRDSIMMIAVSFGDRTCTQLVFDGKGALIDERPLPVSKRIGFDGLVTLYGYREQDPQSREGHEAFIKKHGCIAKKVFGEIKSTGGKPAIAALHKSMQFDSEGKERREHFVPFCVPWEELLDYASRRNRRPNCALHLQQVLRAFCGVDGLNIIWGGGNIARIEINSEAARRFCGGVWLEAVVYGLVQNVFKQNVFKRTNAQIVAGAKLAVAGEPPPSSNALPDDMELDVVIVIDDQLHVIEVKAVTTSKGFGEHIPKLVKIRQELGSQVMRVYLVAPLLNKTNLDRGGFSSRALKQGVTLLYGLPPWPPTHTGGALKLLEERLKKLVQ